MTIQFPNEPAETSARNGLAKVNREMARRSLAEIDESTKRGITKVDRELA